MADNMSRTARRTKKTPQKKNTNKKPIWKIILFSFLFLFIAAGIAIGAVGAYWIVTAPDLDPDKLTVPLSTTLNDKFGEPFATLELENRELVRYEELPDVLIDAVIATEDARFFEHAGIDLKRLGGAIVANITDGFGSQGASTITHQVVENFFLSNEKQIKLKVQEQWLALKLERQYSKQEILEMYLNKIYYGSGAYGVKAAAKTYFGITDLNELNLVQAAILAGLPQRPSAYDPFQNPELTKERVDTVLTLMVRHDKISEEDAEEARQVDITSLLHESSEEQMLYGAFIDQVNKEIEEKLEGVSIFTDGLTINTTMDTSVQDRVEFLLTDSESNPIDYGSDAYQGAIVVLDTKTGAIQAIGGRRNSSGAQKELNYAINGKFHPGSTIKPIFSFGPMIEYNQMSTYHQVNDDKPIELSGGGTIQNSDKRYSGWITARQALSRSRNIPTVRLFEEVGADKAQEFGTQLGLNVPDDLFLSDSIGGGKLNISPLELAGAYRAFGNEGISSEPYAVTSVEFPDGSTIDLRPDQEAVIQDYTAYMITDMLKTVFTDGTWAAGSLNGLPVAGKTGTTDDSKDRWFAGYTTNFTIAAWIGDHLDEERNRIGLPSTSHWTVAQQMFRETLLYISEGLDTADFARPNSVVEVTVERGTNPPQLASEFTPSNQRVRELFVRGTEPSQTSERFDELAAVTGLTASYNEEANAIEVDWDYDASQEVQFIVSASVDGGAMQELTTTEETALDISQVEAGATYTIQVVAQSTANSSLMSDPVTTSVTVAEEEENIPAVTGLSASFVEAQGIIDVSWSYDGDPATFEVVVNGRDTQTVQSQGIEISNVVAGETYSIAVTAVGADGTRADTQTTSVTIPAAEEPEPEPDPTPEPDPEPEPEEEQEEEESEQQEEPATEE